MDHRERLLSGSHGFDWHIGIVEGSVSWPRLRDITKPRWFGLLMCRFGKHAWWLIGMKPNLYRCLKCGRFSSANKVKPNLRTKEG
jgi:hypothetical protein